MIGARILSDADASLTNRSVSLPASIEVSAGSRLLNTLTGMSSIRVTPS